MKVSEFQPFLFIDYYKMEVFDSKRILKKFGIHLRELRNSKSLTLEDVSAYSGVDTSDIGKIERGEINLSFSTLCKLAIGLDVKLSHLVDIDLR